MNLLKWFDKANNWHEFIFQFIYYFAWIIYIFSLLGIHYIGKDVFDYIQNGLRVYISLFLIFKFNPFTRKNVFTDFDKHVVFEAGIFIFSTTVLNSFIKEYINHIKW